MKKQNYKIALLLALVVFFVMLFSTFYIAVEADHDCNWENCPICYQISVCENTLKTLNLGVVAIAVSVALTYSIVILFCMPESNCRQATLITLKVKLSN